MYFKQAGLLVAIATIPSRVVGLVNQSVSCLPWEFWSLFGVKLRMLTQYILGLVMIVFVSLFVLF